MLTGEALRDRRHKAGMLELAHALDRDWKLAEAAEQWRALCEHYPDEPAFRAGYGNVLTKLNRCEQSRKLLTEALATFPDHFGIMVELAHVMHREGNLDQSLAMSLRLRAMFPDEVQSYTCAARAYRDLFRYDEAEAVLRDGDRRLPGRFAIITELAVLADVRGDWEEGLARWTSVRDRFPENAFGFAGMGAALKRLKRYDDADAVMVTGMALMPDDWNLGVNYAWVADERGDWEEALRRWQALHARFPNVPRVRSGLIESQGRANLARIDLLAAQPTATTQTDVSQPAVAPSLPDASVGEMPFRDLFMRFESLGENCELGFVQQHFGAEPLGLLRWAGVSLDKLLHGLETGFEGVGSPETTQLTVNPANHEYVTSDSFYGLNMHTFITRDEANEDRIFQKLRRRMVYLRDKLFEDLRAGEKIMVYQSSLPVGDDELRRLHAAIRRHGPAPLFFVQQQDAENPPGSLRTVQDGLLAGYLDRVGNDGKNWTISYDLWVELCEGAMTRLRPDAAAGR